MRMLIIEDDPEISGFIKKELEQEGFSVDCVDNGNTGLHMAVTEPYDVAIIDIMLPGKDGLTIIETLRKKKINLPVLILSAKHTVSDRVRGFQKGGDDYLVKPFSISELYARVQALIRRSKGSGEVTWLSSGDVTMDLIKREVKREEDVIELQPREFSLLEYLMKNAGKPVSKAMILEHIWDFHFDPQTNVVDVLVCRLRNKVDKDYSETYIHTIRGVGYAFKTTS